MSRSRYLIYSLVAVLFLSVTARAAIDLSDSVIQKFEKKYGAGPADDIRQWRELLQASREISEMEKLVAVNNFFNRKITFIDDIVHWGKKDYWATPVEFIWTISWD